MTISTMIIKATDTIEEVKASLINFFSFDNDWSGENGEEYLLDEAKDAGYESNNEYFINTYLTEKTPESIEKLIENYFESNAGYWEFECSTVNLDEVVQDGSFMIVLATRGM